MTLRRLTVARVFWRSLFIQAGFNTEGLQTLGLLYALEPALKALYPAPEAEQAALRRHLTPFNTHPYVAAALVGGILHHEEALARGEESADAVAKFKTALMGPLAALGDGFFWRSLRPAVGALSVALVPLISAWAAVVFLVLYNLVHLSARAWLFRLGLRYGDGLVTKLSGARIPTWGHRLRGLGAVCAAGVGAWYAVSFGLDVESWPGLGATFACVGAALVAAAVVARGRNPTGLLYAVAAVAIGLSVWAG